MAKSFNNSILSVRDGNGNIIDIPAIKGKDGTSITHSWGGVQKQPSI